MKEHEIGPDLSLHAMWEAEPVATAAAPLSLPSEKEPLEAKPALGSI